MAEVRFDSAYGLCVVRVASFLNSGIFYGTNKCGSLCFSYFYNIPQCITKFVMDLVFVQPGLIASLTVRHLRFDKSVFSARQVCIMKFEIPRCD